MTTKTLRYYDQERILVPSYRNRSNGYRLYTSDDIEKAGIVRDMRNFGFTISEMKDALRNIRNPDDFLDYLDEKIRKTRDLIGHYRRLIDDIEVYLEVHESEQREKETPPLAVTETEIPVMNVASIRFCGQYFEIGKYFEKLYKIAQNKVDGLPITCYHSLEYCEMADIEVCVPISGKLKNPEITIRTIPFSKALSVKYIGDYKGLKFAYSALFDYASKNHLTYHAPIIEIYQKGYGTTMAGNPTKYETNIYLPLK